MEFIIGIKMLIEDIKEMFSFGADITEGQVQMELLEVVDGDEDAAAMAAIEESFND